MGKFWMKFWIWTKITVFSLVIFYVAVFVFENLGNKANVWYSYRREIESTTLMLCLVAFIAGGVFTILVRTTIVTMRQMREVKERNRHEKLQRDVESMKSALSQPNLPGEKIE
jgi:uncharacterized integral membrane protein